MRILREDTAILVVDYQEKIMPAMANKEELTERSVTLLKGMSILGVPMIMSEQYPKGLGRTIEAIREAVGEQEYLEKASFSCCDDEKMMQVIENTGKKNIVVCGIEAHVCVLQSVIDLIEKGYNVLLAEDCISSRNPRDKENAIRRAMSEGALITTCEAILFELTRYSGTTLFKEISKLIK